MVIDKNKIYELEEYKFKNFAHLSDEEKLSVWKWRNNESIRKFMYNSDLIPFENHIRFLGSLSVRDDVAYWLVSKNDQVVGVTNLTSIDYQLSKAELGYYMIPEMLNSGIGLDFAFTNFLFAFSCIGCTSLFGGIDKLNSNAIVLDTYLGCKLNTKDIDNLKSVKYIRWTLQAEDFMRIKDTLNNYRNLVRYMKVNKDLFNNIKSNA
jgi:UDP-4-amino-4,6-dideoxy-N-acetyl-beta-L-altrosamine N-acetyltransferase